MYVFLCLCMYIYSDGPFGPLRAPCDSPVPASSPGTALDGPFSCIKLILSNGTYVWLLFGFTVGVALVQTGRACLYHVWVPALPNNTHVLLREEVVGTPDTYSIYCFFSLLLWFVLHAALPRHTHTGAFIACAYCYNISFMYVYIYIM